MAAVLLLTIAAVATFTLIRSHKVTPAAQPETSALSGQLIAMDFDGNGSGWVVTAAGGPSPMTAYWTSNAGRSWHRALGLESGSIGYLKSFGPEGAVLTYFPVAPGFKQGIDSSAGALYVTTDGGRHWISNPLPGRPVTTSIFAGGPPNGSAGTTFNSPAQGTFYGSVGSSRPGLARFSTTDAGRSWKQLSELSPGQSPWVLGPDGHAGIAPTVAARSQESAQAPAVRVTTDAGATSSAVTLPPLPANSGYPGLFSEVTTIEWTSSLAATLLLRIQIGSQGVGEAETFYAYNTTDGGHTWSQPALVWSGKVVLDGIPLPVVLGPDHWVVAADNRLTVTMDGGRTSKAVQLPLSAPWTATQVDFPDATHGYLAIVKVNSCGLDCRVTILRSSDGGQSWSLMTGPNQSPSPVQSPSASPSPSPSPAGGSRTLVSTSFVTPSIGWTTVFDEVEPRLPGTMSILRTDDGGAHWRRQFSWKSTLGPPAQIDGPGSTTFFNVNVGFVLGEVDFATKHEYLYRTRDGGSSWQRLELPGLPGPGWYMSFSGPSDAWVLTNYGAATGHSAGDLYHSSDAGSTWASVMHFDPSNSNQGVSGGGDKNGVVFTSARQGWLLGWTGNGGVALGYVTRDGGATWTRLTLPVPPGVPNPGDQDSSGRYFSINEELQPVRCLGSVCVMPMAACWGSGDLPADGMPCRLFLYTTHDAGSTWSVTSTPVVSSTAHHINTEVLAPADWLAAAGNQVWTTSDAGATWSSSSAGLGPADEVAQIRFLDRSTGWELAGTVVAPYAGPSRGVNSLLRTTDGGRTWTRLPVSG